MLLTDTFTNIRVSLFLTNKIMLTGSKSLGRVYIERKKPDSDYSIGLIFVYITNPVFETASITTSGVTGERIDETLLDLYKVLTRAEGSI